MSGSDRTKRILCLSRLINDETRNTLLANTQQNEELGNVNENGPYENGPYENVPPPDCETAKRVSKRKKDISKELPHSEKENPKKPKRKPPLRTRNQKIEDDSDSYEPSSDGDSEKEYEEIAKKRRPNVQKKLVTKGKQVHTPWSTDEQMAITTFFKNQIRNFKTIGLKDAEECINANQAALSRRTVLNVKHWYFNYLKKLKKMMGKDK